MVFDNNRDTRRAYVDEYLGIRFLVTAGAELLSAKASRPSGPPLATSGQGGLPAGAGCPPAWVHSSAPPARRALLLPAAQEVIPVKDPLPFLDEGTRPTGAPAGAMGSLDQSPNCRPLLSWHRLSTLSRLRLRSGRLITSIDTAVKFIRNL